MASPSGRTQAGAGTRARLAADHGGVTIFDDLARSVVTLTTGRIRVAVDGVDGAGKTMFAAALALSVEKSGRVAITSTVDGFHRPRAFRYRQGTASPDGYFEDSYDYR